MIWQFRTTEAKTFEQASSIGQLRGKVTAEAIPFDPEGRITRTARYAQLPRTAFGDGWMSQLNLETTDDCDWAVNTIVDPAAIQELSEGINPLPSTSLT